MNVTVNMTSKFHKLYPNATNIRIGSDGEQWGIWFELDGETRFYPIENINDMVKYEVDEINNGVLKGADSKLCLN